LLAWTAHAGFADANRAGWRGHGLQPHRVESFKISNDPQFAEKLQDIVGLYLNPPEHALVLCVDEKSQIQALDRTQPGLPLKRGRSQTMTHDLQTQRHGNSVRRSQCGQRRSLRLVSGAASTSGVAQVSASARSNHAAASGLTPHRRQLRYPQTPQGTALVRAPSTIPHALHSYQCIVAQHGGAFLPRSHPEPPASRCVSRSPELIMAIADYIARHNENPKPFISTARASDILEKVKRARRTLYKSQSA
jgi:hypothetical protein